MLAAWTSSKPRRLRSLPGLLIRPDLQAWQLGLGRRWAEGSRSCCGRPGSHRSTSSHRRSSRCRRSDIGPGARAAGRATRPRAHPQPGSARRGLDLAAEQQVLMPVQDQIRPATIHDLAERLGIDQPPAPRADGGQRRVMQEHHPATPLIRKVREQAIQRRELCRPQPTRGEAWASNRGREADQRERSPPAEIGKAAARLIRARRRPGIGCHVVGSSAPATGRKGYERRPRGCPEPPRSTVAGPARAATPQLDRTRPAGRC